VPCLDDETAALVLTHGLSEEALAEVDAHVDGCAECFALLASLAETMTPPHAASVIEKREDDDKEDPAGADPLARGRSTWKRGSTIGRYVLIEQIGAGGMGMVFAAEDPALGRTIAIKLVRSTMRSDRSNEQLLAEARMMAQLSHPNVVPVYDVGTHDGFVFLAMELIEGTNLRTWLLETKRSWQEVQRVFLEAGRGLVAAHRAGLVHRDFKPDNVLVGKDGRVVVTDFGLAHSTLSPSDRVAGTLVYMAPEQRDGQIADSRSDQYSFAVALSEALTGERPSSSASRERNEREAGVPAWLSQIVTRGMSAHPGERFPTTEALLDALARDPRARRRRVAAAAASLVVVGLLAAFAWSSRDRRAHACADAVPTKLASVWGPAKKDAVHRAFAATGKGFAESSWQTVEGELDAYAVSWTSMHVEACDATFARHEQSTELLDLRVACLAERLAELQGATTLFAAADARVVANAPLAVRALTPVASCGDTRALRAIKPPPPALAARVAELRQALARTKALRDGGRLSEALSLLRTIAEEAKATGYEPLEATALHQLGDVLLANGDAKEADPILGSAALAADTARDDTTRAKALTRQLYAAGFVLEQFSRVASLDAQISSVIARIGGDDELEGDRLQTMGMIALAERDLPAAEDRLSRAIGLREKKLGPRGRRVAMSRHSRCLVFVEEQKLESALAECTLALDIWKEALGENHPDTSLALKNVGRIELKLGRVDDGCRDLEQALTIEESTLTSDHPTIATTLLHLADCHAARADDAGALALDLRALSIREAKLGPRHPRTGEALSAVGARYAALHDPDHAKPFLDRARAILAAKDAAVEAKP
jgi:serine/threonine protein kinase/tetratricopeptide (TPR) repeat protein